MFEIVRGNASPSIEFVASNSTTGDAESLAHNTEGITASYQRHAGGRPLQAAQSITLADLASATAAWTSGGIKSRGSGLHRLDLPAAAVVLGSDGADRVVVTVAKSGVTCVVPTIQLTNPTLTKAEIEQLRYRLGIDGTAIEPGTAEPNLGELNVRVTYGVFAAAQGGTTSGAIRVQAATTWIIPLSGVAIPNDFEKAYFTLKAAVTDTDANAILQIVLSNPSDSGDGLKRLNKAAASVGDLGKAEMSLDEDGQPTIRIAPEIAAQIANGGVWDIKTIKADPPFDDVQGITTGTFSIVPIVTQAVT